MHYFDPFSFEQGIPRQALQLLPAAVEGCRIPAIGLQVKVKPVEDLCRRKPDGHKVLGPNTWVIHLRNPVSCLWGGYAARWQLDRVFHRRFILARSDPT
ncbi:hypothetical protein StoSoilA2_19120 [Arthrobacter sp. StoSoilA2]|nr:hypothetical protein StoSoilA2_19120 [Arthrobacter sp. StoSoilA2]